MEWLTHPTEQPHRPARCRLSVAAHAAIMTIGGFLGGSPVPAGERYDEWTFLGYACGRDCTAHKAGFAWAERRRIGDPAACANADRRFVEGCLVYVDERLSVAEAGWRWAAENDVTDARECAGAGPAFRRGCERYLVPGIP